MAFIDSLTMVSVMLPRAEVAAERVEEVPLHPGGRHQGAPSTRSFPPPTPLAASWPSRTSASSTPTPARTSSAASSFTVHAGQTLGVIGSTGCGESTLVQLIPRLYDVTGGKVTLDGIDVRDLAPLRAAPPRGLVGPPGEGMLLLGHRG